MNFPENVENAKNIVSGSTMMQRGGNLPVLVCLIKIKMTADGHGCEIIGRSNDITPMYEEPGLFAKVIIGNILEIIALKK
jgi:hypothetical protein